MPRLRHFLLPLAALVGLLPAVALPDAATEDLELNRRDLARWRQHPAAYERLRQAARDFLALPAEEQARLVRLDQELHRQGPAAQARLLDALARYADWVQTLPEADRQQIEAAPDRVERLRRIRALRQRQWLRRLPERERAGVEKLEGRACADRIARLRREERQRQEDWQVATRPVFWDALLKGRQLPQRPMPAHLADLAPADQAFVQEHLKPRLSPAEWEGLGMAQGHWPRFARFLVQLADSHPPALAGARGPTHFAELPAEVRRRLQGPKGALKLRKAEGKWPGFAVAVTKLVRELGQSLPNELWPARRDDLTRDTREFLEKQLGPVLDEGDRKQLKAAEGHWPAFPRTLQALAAKHYLSVPWLTLPGPRARWDGYRLHRHPAVPGLPPVARQTLRDFALIYLSAKEREALNLSAPDSADWERLARLYFERK
jgi:hypothetical protein